MKNPVRKFVLFQSPSPCSLLVFVWVLHGTAFLQRGHNPPRNSNSIPARRVPWGGGEPSTQGNNPAGF